MHDVWWREGDGAVPQVQAFEGDHVSWVKKAKKGMFDGDVYSSLW